MDQAQIKKQKNNKKGKGREEAKKASNLETAVVFSKPAPYTTGCSLVEFQTTVDGGSSSSASLMSSPQVTVTSEKGN